MSERVLHSRSAFKGKLLELRLDEVALPRGGQATREIAVHPGAVAILPLDDEDRLILVRQYRHACGRVLLELPAGTLEAGEDPDACARRELVEEIGHRPGHLERLVSFYTSPGFSTEVLHLYLAANLAPVEGQAEADEQIEVERLELDQAMARIGGEIADAKTIVGLLWLRQRLGAA